jgi:LAS superfamily LD-carboxypeptidase LdcB
MEFFLISLAQLVGKEEQLVSKGDKLSAQQDCALVSVPPHFLHRDIVDDWSALQQASINAGFDLAVVSAYRSFERQLLIWNEKASGKRAVFDANGQILDVRKLDDKSLVFAILRWSALPGGSRHHWGTDIDVYDRAAVASDYAVQLVDDEVNQGGVFEPLHNWLDSRIESASAQGFYRPYQGGVSQGIAAERWHLSHRPTAEHFRRLLTAETLYRLLEQETDMRLRDTVLAHFDEIFTRYIAC